MQRYQLACAAVALVLSTLATWVAWHAGTVITLALLVAALFCVAFALLTTRARSHRPLARASLALVVARS
jgi:hypothetical protein